MRDEAKQALRGLADASWPREKTARPDAEPPEFFLDVSNALHSLEDVARPADEYVGVSLADAEEAALVAAVFDAWTAVAQQLPPGADDATVYGAAGWPRVMRAAQAALARMDAHDRA
jgi:hypothetical protein